MQSDNKNKKEHRFLLNFQLGLSKASQTRVSYFIYLERILAQISTFSKKTEEKGNAKTAPKIVGTRLESLIM